MTIELIRPVQACTGANPDDFDLDAGEQANLRAVAVCHRCPLLDTCAPLGGTTGIYGGKLWDQTGKPSDVRVWHGIRRAARTRAYKDHRKTLAADRLCAYTQCGKPFTVGQGNWSKLTCDAACSRLRKREVDNRGPRSKNRTARRTR